MSSERQIIANRLNGAKSRGAITPEGRLASSRNATIHGLLSEAIVLDGESAERFNALHDSLIEEFQPETSTERGLVETMAVCRWRLMRIWVLETSAVTHEIRNKAELNQHENQPTQAALAYRSLSDGTRWLDVFNRYEARFDRQLSRAITRFIEVRARRKKEKKENVFFPNEPNSTQGVLNRDGDGAAT